MQLNSTAYNITPLPSSISYATLNEVKRHMLLTFDSPNSLDFNDDDEYITSLIESSSDEITNLTGYALYTPCVVNLSCRVSTPYVILPIKNITSIITVACPGTLVDIAYEFYNEAVKKIRVDFLGDVNISAACDGTALIPKTIKRALLELVAYRYAHRGDTLNVSNLAKTLDIAAKNIITSFY